MPSPAVLTWSYLNILTKDRFEALLSVYSSLDEALTRLNPETLVALGCRNDTVEKVLVQMEEFDPARYLREMQAHGIQLITLADAQYPSRLKDIADAPPFLYYRGDLSLLAQPCIALVGTRKMSPYGKRVAEFFAPRFVQSGMITVSGLALGIDAQVAEETIRAGGKTVAVLGNGLATIYPASHARLADKIVDGGGLLLSEYPIGLPPDKYTFPARNRIIAALSLGTVVLEAPEESGAIITAELAFGYGRDVYAVPGQIFDPNTAGCHMIIQKQQAKLVRSADDVLRDLGVHAPDGESTSSFEPETDQEKQIYAVLTSMPQSIDDLVQKSGLTTGNINAALTMMELAGGVKNVGGGMWVRR